MTHKRFKPEVRKEEILSAALKLAAQDGYTQITRKQIAEAVGITEPAIQYHFGTMAKLRTELMRYAVKVRSPRVVAQGLAVGNRHAARADDELKHAAWGALLDGDGG